MAQSATRPGANSALNLLVNVLRTARPELDLLVACAFCAWHSCSQGTANLYAIRGPAAIQKQGLGLTRSMAVWLAVFLCFVFSSPREAERRPQVEEHWQP
mmetsp:Transcript_41976/g.74218  ORF Transcript_41976/g.74218 Transcript_41976/m.74218 type:complete len:100 (-) Transcript_41976:244-543(-)